jgi:hypothetical protein
MLFVACQKSTETLQPTFSKGAAIRPTQVKPRSILPVFCAPDSAIIDADLSYTVSTDYQYFYVRYWMANQQLPTWQLSDNELYSPMTFRDYNSPDFAVEVVGAPPNASFHLDMIAYWQGHGGLLQCTNKDLYYTNVSSDTVDVTFQVQNSFK